VLGLAAFVMPASASAALIGPPTVEADPFEIFGESCGEACTFVNVKLPEGKERSPVTGTITKWRVNVDSFNVSTDHTLRLQVVKRTRNEPGVAGDKFEAVRQSRKEEMQLGTNTLETSLEIRKGQFIGLRYPGNSISVGALEGGRFLDFVPPLLPTGGAAKPELNAGVDRHLLLNATVRD
jgi:hypothetical protein